MIARNLVLSLLALAFATGCGFNVKGPESKDLIEKDTITGDAGEPEIVPLPDVEDSVGPPDAPEPEILEDVQVDVAEDESSGCESDKECDDGDDCTEDMCDFDTGECSNLYLPELCSPCIPEGEGFEAVDEYTVCCEGLTSVDDCVGWDGGCECPNCPCYVCTKCGNGECGPGENHCNCPEDCDEPKNECKYSGGSCFPAGEGNGECPAGWVEEEIPGCPDDDLCCFEAEQQCVPEGVNKGVGGDAPPCCDGLASIPVASYGSEDKSCAQVSGLVVCANCGNHVCEEEWENPCNCDTDCPWPTNECAEEGGECIDGEGIVPGPEPCPPGWNTVNLDGCGVDQVCCMESEGCFGGNECGPGAYCQFPVGDCGLNGNMGQCVTIQEECDMNWLPECGCNNKTYANECFMAQGHASKLHAGECDSVPCFEEGVEYDPSENNVGCCPGLNAVYKVYVDDSGGCSSSSNAKKICVKCPNGICGPGENYCNCSQDCQDEPTDLPCEEMGGICTPPIPGSQGCGGGEQITNGICNQGMICCKY